jgi:hypothetical protein
LGYSPLRKMIIIFPKPENLCVAPATITQSEKMMNIPQPKILCEDAATISPTCLGAGGGLPRMIGVPAKGCPTGRLVSRVLSLN